MFGGGGGRDRVGGRYYFPLYQDGIKEVRIKSMETTEIKYLKFNCIDFKPTGPGVLTLKNPSQVGQVDEMMGVIRHSGPAHPKYATLEGRLRTFGEWPPALKQRPREFAEAGFYYIGNQL